MDTPPSKYPQRLLNVPNDLATNPPKGIYVALSEASHIYGSGTSTATAAATAAVAVAAASVTSACLRPKDMETPASKTYVKYGIVAFILPEFLKKPGSQDGEAGFAVVHHTNTN